MSLRQMEYLLTVAELQSFTAAAQTLRVTQSGLSQQVQALERTVGTALLERIPRGVHLTEAGELFAKHARIALAAQRRAYEEVEDFRAGNVGRLDVAAVYSVTAGLLPRALKAWRELHPGVSLRIHEFQHRALLEEAARTGTMDLTIGPEPSDWQGYSHRLGREAFVLVLPKDTPVVDRIIPYQRTENGPRRSVGRLPLSRLRDHDWVMLTVQPGLVDHVSNHIIASGLRDPQVVLRTSQMDAAARMAAAGAGAAMLPEHAVAPELDALICEPMPRLHRNLSAFAMSQPSATAVALIDMLAELTDLRSPVEQSSD